MKIKKINPSLQQDLLFINKLNCCKFNFLIGKAVSLLLIAFLPSSKPVKKETPWSACFYSCYTAHADKGKGILIPGSFPDLARQIHG